VIGVAADAADLAVAREFFELFKTPWEAAVPGRQYSILLSTTGRYDGFHAPVVLAYGSTRQPVDDEMKVSIERLHAGDAVWGDWRIPIYGRVALFGGEGRGLTVNGKPIQYEARLGTRVVQRLGYDLFHEVGHLLTEGQPPSRASVPTLELHIDVLRRLLVEEGVSFVEVPPVPNGHAFTCCLTHDIDFFGIKRHKFDRTLAGFVGRASFATLVQLLRGRRSLKDAIANFKALLVLPLVFLGIERDFWAPFLDYAQTEPPNRSTFFMVPFKDRPGITPNGGIDETRAIRYDLAEITDEIRSAASRGSEFGVHGIDSWRDAPSGEREQARLTQITRQATAGVRMHWLYFDRESPRRLESAGYDYDSTWGYNETVGYRAGTSQAFRFPGTERLMELPLSIMDSALLSHDRLALTPSDAVRHCDAIVENAERFGGTVVVNWHCRSLAPERLWVEPYRALLNRLSGGAWFARGTEAVNWFRWRRSIHFAVSTDDGSVRIDAPVPSPSGKGGLIRIHRPGELTQEIPFDGAKTYTAFLETERSETFF
jgi:hypothetical protein